MSVPSTQGQIKVLCIREVPRPEGLGKRKEPGMVAVRRVGVKPAKKGVIKEDSGNIVQKSMSVSVQVNFLVSTGNKDRERTFEEWQSIIFDAVRSAGIPDQLSPRITGTGGYYIINGRVCLPDDYDPETKDFKPGRKSPAWAQTATEQQQQMALARIEREKSLPEIARNPTGLLTTKETDAGRKGSMERPVVKKGVKVSVRRPKPSAEPEWDEGDIFDDGAAEEVVKQAVRSVRIPVTRKPIKVRRR